MAVAYRTPAEIVALIVQLRRQQGISQKQLAQAIGIDPASMNRVEKGERALALAELIAIATHLDANVDEFLRQDEPAGVLLRAAPGSPAAVSESLGLFRDIIEDYFGADAAIS
jgi:transcriptional regulator with XRE-family HTH domain